MSRASFTIGITGGSGSGKTYFLQELSRQFGPDELCLISQDHYYRPRQNQTRDEQGITNFDLPGSIDHERFTADIRLLKSGATVRKEEYTFNNPAAKPGMLEFRPAPIIVVEGLFILHFKEIEDELDLAIFIEAKDHIKLSRRIRRDNDERGYDLQDVLYRYQHHVMPVYEQHIGPLKDRADLIIPNNTHFKRALQVITLAIRAKLADYQH
jgi:uridine kinase